MSTIYGAIPWEMVGNPQNLNYDSIGKNSEAFTVYDPVYTISGQLAVAGTTTSVTGVYLGTSNPSSTITKTVTNGLTTLTLPSTNAGSTGLRAQPGYIPVDETTQFLMGTNGDMTGNATDPGTYYKLTANTTGTIQVDQANGVQTTTSRNVMIKKVDPFNEGGTGAGSGLRKVIVVFVRRPTWIDQ